MRQRFWIVVAVVAFVAAMLKTVPRAITEQHDAVARASAGDSVAVASEVPLSGHDYEARQVQCPTSAPNSSGIIGSLRAAKNGACAWLVANGMGGVWKFQLNAREYIFDLRAWLWLALFIALEQLIPAKPLRKFLTANKVLDFFYPVLNATLRTLVLVALYNPVRSFYDTYLAFANTRVLDGLPLFVQGLGAFLILDFAHWFSHYMRHKIRWLWHFHSIHHSQVEMSPWTAFRAHPLEAFWDFLLVMIPMGIVGGDLAAWVVVMTLYAVVWPPFTHANIKTNLGIFKWLLVSPQYHRVHHSIRRDQYDLNFGSTLVVWDWMFGTIHRDMESYPDTGVPNTEYVREESLKPHGILAMWFKHLYYPFRMIGRSIMHTAGAPVPPVPGLPPQQVTEPETETAQR